MKKLFVSMSLVVLALTLSACSSRETLYVLNWGDYINEDVVEAFEREFNVRVLIDEVGSNEQMQSRIMAGTTPYDIAVPSEYMIDKLFQDGYLTPIDYSLLPNLESLTLIEKAYALYSEEAFKDHMIPYFFGTVGIMYNTSNPAVEEAVLEHGFGALFDANSSFSRGMYNSSRDAVASALIHLGYSVNSTDEAELNEAEALLISANFSNFEDDALKSRVASGQLDMALVYSGDYFDELYAHEEDDLDVNFEFYAPMNTNIWIDAFVIPSTSENTELAHQFINFFLDMDNALENADYVGYTPVYQELFDVLWNDYEYSYYEDYNPYPDTDGIVRQVYRYMGQAHMERLEEILHNARTRN